MRTIRYLVVGGGALGRHHARIAAGLAGVELVAVAEPRLEQGRAVAAEVGTRWIADYRDVIDSIDAASIVVPTSLHRRVAADFIDRGISVLVEKPLACNVEDGRALVMAAERTGTALQVGHIERFNPAFREAATRIREPKYIRAERLSPYAFRSLDISAVYDLMIHDIDLALTLAGSPVREVQGFGICLLGGHTDAVQARLVFENGCVADLVANRVSPDSRRRLQVWGLEGCVNADLHTREVTHFRPASRLLAGELPHTLAQQPGADIAALKAAVFGQFLETLRPQLHGCDQLTEELQSFVNCVRTGAAPLVDGRAGLAALAVADRITTCVDAHHWTGNSRGPVGPHAALLPPLAAAA